MDSSTKFRIARTLDIEKSDASTKGEDVLIIDEGGKGMYIGTGTPMPSKHIAVGPNQLKTINGESLVGTGDIEISSGDIVIFNYEGDPAEEYAKLVDAYNNNRIVYLGMANDDGTLSPSLPVQFTIYNETDPIYVNAITINGGSAISLAGGVFIVSPTEISIGEGSYIEFITDDERLFLSGDGTYRQPSGCINLNSEIPQNERNQIETAIRNGFSCFARLYENYVPCHIVADISDPESDYKVYTFTSNDTGGLTLTEWTITLENITATNTTDFNLNNYALKSETGVAYAEYTGTSTAVAVTTKYGYFPTTLVEGARVSVKFEGSLTYITTLNVNGTGAKNVYYKGNSLTSGMINRYNTYDFVYDGSYWRIIGVNTYSDTHYTAENIVGASATAKSNATAANGNVYLNLIENSAVRSSHNIKGEGSVTVTSDASGNIIINGAASEASSDANVQAVDTAETLDDVNDLSNVKYVSQTLTTAQKTVARNNIGAGDVKSSDLASVATSGSYNDLTDKPTIPAEQVNVDWNATSGKAQILNKPTIPAAVTESTVSGWGFTKNTGTYSKPSGGIPKTDLASAVQTSLGKADTALQSYTEQYKGTITGVSANGTSVATSGVANIPAASTSKYGVTKLSSSTSSTSTSLAATASAVKAAYDLANGKQDKLVSGTNIKTINGTSILGSGDIAIEVGGSNTSNTYIIQDFDVQFLQEYQNNTGIQAPSLASQQALFDAINLGKVILLPDYLEGPTGYFTMSGTAEDGIYLTGVIEGSIYYIEWWIDGAIDIYKYTKPLNGIMLPKNATLGAAYYTNLSIEDIKDVIDIYGGENQINHEEYESCFEAVQKGLPVYIHNSLHDGEILTCSAISVASSGGGQDIYMTFFYENEQYNVEFNGQYIKAQKANNRVVLDETDTIQNLAPNVLNFLPDNDELNRTYSFSFNNPAPENEWRLVVDCYFGSRTISFPDNVRWANGITPDIGAAETIEFSFIQSYYEGENLIYLGTWTKYSNV